MAKKINLNDLAKHSNKKIEEDTKATLAALIQAPPAPLNRYPKLLRIQPITRLILPQMLI